jgi:hypothetical protein
MSSQPSEQPCRPDLGGLFEVEKELLVLESARVAGQLAVLADHSVTRNDDQERVAPDRGADLSGGRAVGKLVGELTVGDGVAVWDGRQPVPDPALKIVAPCFGRQVELRAVAAQELTELRCGLGEQGVALGVDAWSERVDGRPVPVVMEVDTDQRIAVGDQRQLAHRAVDHRMSCVHTSKTSGPTGT